MKPKHKYKTPWGYFFVGTIRHNTDGCDYDIYTNMSMVKIVWESNWDQGVIKSTIRNLKTMSKKGFWEKAHNLIMAYKKDPSISPNSR